MALRVFTKYFDVTESSVCITEDTNLTLACLQMRTLLLTGRPNNRQTDQTLMAVDAGIVRILPDFVVGNSDWAH